MISATVKSDLRDPFASSFVPPHAFEAGLVIAVRAPVALVFRPCCFAQIREAVIQAVGVDVVDVVAWPFAVNMEPRQPVCFVQPPIDPDVPVTDVALSLDVSGD